MGRGKKNYNTKLKKIAKKNENGKKAAAKGPSSKSFLERRQEQKLKNWNDWKKTSAEQGEGADGAAAGAAGAAQVDPSAVGADLAKKLLASQQRSAQFELEQQEGAALFGGSAASSAGGPEGSGAGPRRENANREAENTRRQFYRELRKVLEASDVIVQVLDARDPESCRNRALEREVLSSTHKKLILLLNKVDLVPKEIAALWEKKLAVEHPVVQFKCGTRTGANATAAKDASEKFAKASSAVLGADNLLQLLKNYARTAAGSKKAIAVGVVGYPNVGKSSVINSLKRSTAVRVGGTAGVTKAMQEVVLDSKVRLIDCPGVVFSGNTEDPSVVLRNAVKVENIKDPVTVVERLTGRISLESLVEYFLPDDATEKIPSTTRGQLKRGGVADLVRSATLVLKDIAQGKFKYYVLPAEEAPSAGTLDVQGGSGSASNSGAKIITKFTEDFDIDALDDVTIIKDGADAGSGDEDMEDEEEESDDEGMETE